ncbi:MAG TPA: class I SAM-dependent methyltransferase [Nitrospirales bacterium]|nr:class I SAM-dependent methyltransferase [Nitrospirales bacterium]
MPNTINGSTLIICPHNIMNCLCHQMNKYYAMPGEYKYFKNEYVDDIDIQNNYIKLILDDIFSVFGTKICVVGDIGCGNGFYTAYLKDLHVIQLHGIDASKYALQCALAKGFDHVYCCSDFSAVPLPMDNESCDFLVNKDVLEHLLDPDFLVTEMARVLKPEGLVLIHVPNDFNVFKRIAFVVKQDTDTYNYFPESQQWNKPHIRFYTEKGINELMKQNGFTCIKDYSDYFACNVRLINRIPGYRYVMRRLARLSPTQFSQGLTFLFQKNQANTHDAGISFA